ncbi:MAG: beta-galactosidase, partial [Clostridia bacterium]|nr:beta-galactosidase [Clostridia bacterium]
MNGSWGFQKGKYEEVDASCLTGKIEVPFCPESALSGIGDKGYINDCVYSRVIEVTEDDLKGRLVLHFGAVDYIAVVYVNGVKAVEHTGGYTAFEVDIKPFARVGVNLIAVAVHDDVRENIPSGKQCKEPDPHGCFYSRSTGIWQTVWLEKTPTEYIKGIKFYPQPDYKTVKTEVVTEGCGCAEIKIFYKGKKVGGASGTVEYRNTFDIELSETHLWEIGKGELYDVEVTFGGDKVQSYFGFRLVSYEGKKFLLNGKSVFQRLVLDQGYYEDGIYTAKDVKQFEEDIDLSVSLGFNGARLHQKVFEQRFLYEADKKGYLVWGEFPSWG